MNFICKVFGHKWNDGCTCVRCGQKRNENHKWERISDECRMKCSICGAEKVFLMIGMAVSVKTVARLKMCIFLVIAGAIWKKIPA